VAFLDILDIAAPRPVLDFGRRALLDGALDTTRLYSIEKPLRGRRPLRRELRNIGEKQKWR
jgi:hypothetical protein